MNKEERQVARYVDRLSRLGAAPMVKWRKWSGPLYLVALPLVFLAVLFVSLAWLGERAAVEASCVPGRRLAAVGDLSGAERSFRGILERGEVSTAELQCAVAGLESITRTTCEQLSGLISDGEGSSTRANNLRAALSSNALRPETCGDLPPPPTHPDVRVLTGTDTFPTRVGAGIDYLLLQTGLGVGRNTAVLGIASLVLVILYLLFAGQVRRKDPGRLQTEGFVRTGGQPAADVESRFREASDYLSERFGDLALAPSVGTVHDTSVATALAAVEGVPGNKALASLLAVATRRPLTTVKGTLLEEGHLLIEASGAAGFGPRTAVGQVDRPSDWTYVDAAWFTQRMILKRIAPNGLVVPEAYAQQELRERAVSAKILLALESRIRSVD